ncbi:MAG TPA: DUF1761 domain-containing protein [Ignavibacteria bacterium]|jgi:hypothetical protein
MHLPDTSINLLPVIAAAVLNMAIGMLWYSPFVLGKLWIKSMGPGQAGKTSGEFQQSGSANPLIYVFNTIAALIFAYVLAHIMKFAFISSFGDGVIVGFWVWLGFVVTTVLPGYLYEKRSKVLYFIFILYQLVAICLMGGLLAIWK